MIINLEETKKSPNRPINKSGNGKFKWDEIYGWNGWNAMIKCRKNDIKMMLNLGGNLGII